MTSAKIRLDSAVSCDVTERDSLPRRRSYGSVTQVGTRDDPLRTFAWEATRETLRANNGSRENA